MSRFCAALLLGRLQNLKRTDEVFGDQFVKRILHREDVILAKLDCTDQDDAGTQNNVPVEPWEQRDQRLAWAWPVSPRMMTSRSRN